MSVNNFILIDSKHNVNWVLYCGQNRFLALFDNARMLSPVNDQVITRLDYFDVHRIVANFAPLEKAEIC